MNLNESNEFDANNEKQRTVTEDRTFLSVKNNKINYDINNVIEEVLENIQMKCLEMKILREL